MSSWSGEPGAAASDDLATSHGLRMLLSLASRQESADLVGYLGTIAAGRSVVARVVHVVEHTTLAGVLFEPAAEAAELVEETVFGLWMAGVGADGAVHHATPRKIGQTIVDEAISWRADTIVLSGQRTRRWQRLVGPGVREDVLRRSPIPVALVSTRPVGPSDTATEHFDGFSHSPWTNRRLGR